MFANPLVGPHYHGRSICTGQQCAGHDGLVCGHREGGPYKATCPICFEEVELAPVVDGDSLVLSARARYLARRWTRLSAA